MTAHRTARAPRLHRDPRLLGLVLVGGTLGTAARYGIERTFPAPAGTWPWATFTINVVGAFALGLLLELLLRSGTDDGWRRAVRIGAGTGVLGGFTTYSTFAVEADLLVRGGHVLLAVGYAAGSVVLGVAAALAGIALAQRWANRHEPGPHGHAVEDRP